MLKVMFRRPCGGCTAVVPQSWEGDRRVLSVRSRTLGPMGMYLVSASTLDLEDESCWPAVFTALAEELEELGVEAEIRIPVHAAHPRGSRYQFEEKLIPAMDGFSALCAKELAAGDAAVFDWDLLVPFDFEGVIELQVPNSYSDTTSVRSAQRLLPVARRVADSLELPDDLPDDCDSLQLTTYFMDLDEGEDEAERPATVAGGRWREDPGTAFYAAMFLRAAEHSLGQSCPMFYS